MEQQNKILTSAFGWLFIGLLVCFGISYCTTLSDDIIIAVYGAFGGIGYLVYLIAELIIAVSLSLFINKLSPIVAKVLYLVYTALTGLSLSGIFIVYTEASIAFVFLATALIFGIFALLGAKTNVDLTKFGIYLLVALIAIIILEIINIFIASNSLDMGICIATIVIFSGYVAYDVKLALNKSFLAESENKGIYCAFQLFIDFINVFIKLLRLFAKNRD